MSAHRRSLLSVIVAFFLYAGLVPLCAQPADFDSAIEALKNVAGHPTDPGRKKVTDNESSRTVVVYYPTVTPGPALLSRLQALFGAYFDAQIDLARLLTRLVRESAVMLVPAQGRLLYNPAHMLILHLPEGWEGGSDVRVAALEDLGKILKQQESANRLLAAYGKGFQQVLQLSALMTDPDTRETQEVIWTTSPRSTDDKERMRYLLLRPIEQAAEIRNETAACRQAIDRFVDDVRAGKRAGIPAIQGLTNIVKPTRFIRHEGQIILVLSDGLLARYYVVAQFDVGPETCVVASERSIFALHSMKQ